MWGKWGSEGAYPLTAHLIDTAAFARVLCDHWVPPTLFERASRATGLEPDRLISAVISGAALHDLGKATAIFQYQILAQHRPSWAEDHSHSLGLPGIPRELTNLLRGMARDRDEQLWCRRHEVAGAAMLHGALNGAGHQGVAALVAGHHGRWNIPSGRWRPGNAIADHEEFLLHDVAWRDARERVLDDVVRVLGCEREAQVPTSLVPLMTALVVLADWLASDLADRDQEVHGDWAEHLAHRLTDARAAVAELLGTVTLEERRFDRVFDFNQPAPAQRELTRPGGPGLRIVAVPTGDGKTEAALGHWLVNAPERQGLYFALPTMTTADAMFARVRSVFAGSGTFGALAHRQAMLHDFYDLAPRAVSGEVHGEHSVADLEHSRWLVGNRRAVLAPVTVGTADQLLLAVVPHRYNFLRLLGAATKTVVFDEVHSYDPYMSTLLERFLEWAGHLELDVVLLSATVPTEALERYINAYRGAPGENVSVAYPYVVNVPRTGEIEAESVEASALATRTLSFVYHRTDHATDLATATAEVVRSLRVTHPTAKIGVIVNQVRRCQQIAADLDGRSGGERIAGDLRVMHSRFPAGERADHAAVAVSTFGKRSTNGAATVVATQVVEQSIDLDFDVLVTDLCPAPSLLQRAGRLHRHDLSDRHRSRPSGCEHPVVHVLVPASADDPEDDGRGWLPYPPSAVRRTWTRGLSSGDRGELRVPDDVQRFIDASHLTLDELTSHDLDAAEEHHLFDRFIIESQAAKGSVRPPSYLERNPEEALRSFATADPRVPTATRWITEDSVDVLLVGEGGWPSSLPLPDHPSRADIVEVLSRSTTIPRRLFARATADHPDAHAPRDGWAKTALEDVRVVPVEQVGLHHDPLLGIVAEQGVRRA